MSGPVCSSNKATGHGIHKRTVITAKGTSMAIRITRILAILIIHNTMRMVAEAVVAATALQILRTISDKAANMGIRITLIQIRAAEPTMICGSIARIRRRGRKTQARDAKATTPQKPIYPLTHHVIHGLRRCRSGLVL
jgi:hypothetical protein